MPGVRSESADRVLRIDDEEADDVLASLSTTSARQILTALNAGPATVSELADETDLTPQNVFYHLSKLTAAGLVRTEGTREVNGNEATVYAPDETVLVSTGTDGGYRLRSGVVGFVTGALLSVACLSPLVESVVSTSALFHHFLHVVWVF